MARSKASTGGSDFRREGGDIKPVSNAAEIAAGKRAAAIQQQSHAQMIKGRIDTFNTYFAKSVEAGAGILKAKQAKEIIAELDKLEGFGKTAIQNQRELDALESPTGQYSEAMQKVETVRAQGRDMSGELPGGLAGAARAKYEKQAAEMIAEVEESVAREKNRLLQGIQSQQETITNIAAITKRYSAMVPGLADDFRKVAASKTGISNIDIIGVYDALTKETAAQAQAKRDQAIFEQHMKNLQTAFGRPYDQISDSDKEIYAQVQGRKMFLENMEADLKQQDLNLQQYDRVALQRLDLQFFYSERAINLRAATLMNSNRGLDFESFKGSQAAYSKALYEERLRVDSFIDGMESRGEVSADRAEFLRKRTQERFDTHAKWFENQENYNAYNAMVAKFKGDEQALLAAMTIDSPLIAFLGETGILPQASQDFYMRWQGGNYNEGEKATFVAKHGEALWNDFVRLSENPDPTKTRLMKSMAGRDEQILPAEQEMKLAPDVGRIKMSEGVAALDRMSDPEYKPKEGDGWYVLGATRLLTATSPFADPDTYRTFEKALQDGRFARALETIPEAKRAQVEQQVLTPMYNHLTTGTGEVLVKALESINAEEGRSVEWDGDKFVLTGKGRTRDSWVAGQGLQADVNSLNRMVELQRNFAEATGRDVLPMLEVWQETEGNLAAQLEQQIANLDKAIAIEEAKPVAPKSKSSSLESLGEAFGSGVGVPTAKEEQNRKIQTLMAAREDLEARRLKHLRNSQGKQTKPTKKEEPQKQEGKKTEATQPATSSAEQPGGQWVEPSEQELIDGLKDFDETVIPEQNDQQRVRLEKMQFALKFLTEQEARGREDLRPIIEKVRAQIQLLEQALTLREDTLRTSGLLRNTDGVVREGPQLGRDRVRDVIPEGTPLNSED